ncbi:hypothetical protein ARMSODRAFT_104269 [Armillaria solidipes]|uniref:Uncharacterized protein n=1 Tax=Armillaria solidipes TaxID=1076256 RepID=A0A2H3AUR8_9AGAR|nr:hypothetical protein ARMSODRAFT_104269 [Armillaria solidipes]
MFSLPALPLSVYLLSPRCTRPDRIRRFTLHPAAQDKSLPNTLLHLVNSSLLQWPRIGGGLFSAPLALLSLSAHSNSLCRYQPGF